MDFDTLNTIFLVISFVLGTLIGSFLNVCICRMPHGQSVIKPRSRCPKCGNGIAWFDNIPILSWLILGARCRYCKEIISWQYPVVEAITGVLFAGVYWKFGLTLATPVYMLFMASMVLVTFIDLTDWTIPNEITFPGIPLGVGLAVVGMVYPDSGLLLRDVFDSILGAVIGGGFLYLIDKVALLVLKKRGMGFGDVKLIALLGAFFGLKAVLFIIFVSCLIGSVVGVIFIMASKRKQQDSPDGEENMTGHYLPFGPYLAGAGVLFVFFGLEAINLYMNYLQPAPISAGM